MVENSSGEAGLFPGNHLDPSAEFSGKALFDIERLLSLKQVEEAKKISEKATNNNNTNTNQSNNENWRFFDPLASPGGDEEMLKLEAILEEKAKKANQGLIIQGVYLARLVMFCLNLLIFKKIVKIYYQKRKYFLK